MSQPLGVTIFVIFITVHFVHHCPSGTRRRHKYPWNNCFTQNLVKKKYYYFFVTENTSCGHYVTKDFFLKNYPVISTLTDELNILNSHRPPRYHMISSERWQYCNNNDASCHKPSKKKKTSET